MINNPSKALKILLWIISVYHIGIGILGALFADKAVNIAISFFNFNLTMTPQTLWVIQPLAAYIIIFGVFAGIAATDPIKYRLFIYGIVTLIGIRIIQRMNFLFRGEEFSVDPARLALAIGIIAAIGISLLFLTKKAERV